MSLTSNKAKLTVRSANSTIANFLSHSDDAKIVVVANSCNINSNVSYFGTSLTSNEAYIGLDTNNIVNKIARFNAFSINLQTNTVVQGNVLPSSNLVYDLGNVDDRWRNMYLSGENIYLNNALLNYNSTSNDISFIDNTTNDYIPINSKSLKIQDSDDYYSILSTGPVGATLSSYSSNGELISSLNLGQGTTDMLPEGTSNLYFSQELANQYIYQNLTLDKIAQGSSNKYIFNNVYNDNLFVTGKLMVTGLEIADLEIILDQQGTCNIGNFHEYIAHVTSNLIFPITTLTSNVIVTEVHNITKESSNIIINEVNTLVNNVSNIVGVAQQFTSQLASFINNDLNTTVIEEGSNLYYTAERVGIIAHSSNTNVSNYLENTSNELGNILQFTSNVISTRISSLTADKISDGTDNKFIINNIYNGDLTVSNLTVIGNIIPSQNEKFNLGSSNNKWHDLYLSGNTIYLNNTVISSDPDTNGIVFKDNSNNLINITTSFIKIQSDPTSSNYSEIKNIGDKITLVSYDNLGKPLSEVSLAHSDTNSILEGSNLYFTSQRVAEIVSGSNLYTSNYIQTVENKLINFLNNNSITLSNDTSNYISNTSNQLANTIQSSSNIISSRISTLTADNIINGTINKFIVNGIYNDNITINATLTTSNLNIIGTTTTINTTTYKTENLEIESQANDGPALKVKQNGVQNIAEFIYNSTDVLIIKHGGNVGIGTSDPQQKLDVNGNIKLSGNLNTITSTEISYLSGVSSSIQTQIDSKQATVTGAATTILFTDLTSDKVLLTNTSGKVAVSTLPSAQLSYLSDVTAAIQAQLNTKEVNISLGSTQYALINNTSGKVAVSTIAKSELEYLSGAGINKKFIIDNVYAGDLTVSNMNMIGNLIPSKDVQFDLGSSNNKWRDLFLSGNTIYLNDTRISSDPSSKGLIIKDSNNELTDITASVIKLSNSESSDFTEIRTMGNNIMLTTLNSDNQTLENFVIKQIDSTDILKEGSNLFYTSHRVADIVSASNIKTYTRISDTSNQILQEIKSLNLSPWYDKNTYVEYSNIQVYPEQIKIYNKDGNTSIAYINYNFLEDPTLTFPTTSLINEGSGGNIMSASVYNVNTSIITSTYPFDNTTDLICWYKFDNNLADILLDSSGNNRTLTNYGNLVSFDNSDYKRGNGSVIFSSTNSAYFEVSNTTQFASDNFTICFWCKISSIENVSQCIASFMQANPILGWDIYIVNNNLQFRTGNTTQLSGSDQILFANFADNTWKHLAITLNKNTATAQIYVNGIHIITTSRIYNNTDINTNFYIGKGPYGNYLSNLSRIDDFRMYNRVLTFNEIKNIMGYTLTRQSGRTSDTYSYYWNGMSTYSGDNAYILLPKLSVDPIITTNAFTVAAWIKNENLNNEAPFFNISKNQNAYYVDILQSVSNNTTSSKLSFTNGNIVSVYNTTWNFVNTTGVWSHYAYTFKYIQNKVYVKLYKNGVLQTPSTGGEFTINNFAFLQTEQSSFATIAKNSTNDISPAYISDFRLYNEELSETMIRLLAELDLPIPTFKTLVDDIYLDIILEEKFNDTSNYIDNTNSLIQNLNNNVSSYINNTSNILETHIKYTSNQLNNSISLSYVNLSNYVASVEQYIDIMTTDNIIEGTANQFIVNGEYDNDLKVNGTLTTSNLNVIGELTSIETIKYQTENIEIISEASDGPGMKVIQNGIQDIAHFYNATNPAFIINNIGYVGIGKLSPTERLDVNGNIIVNGNINNITSNELNFLSGTASNIQSQFKDVYNNQRIAVLNTSNNIVEYILATSYNLHNSASNYTDNILFTNSNIIIQYVKQNNTNLSNYIINTSNDLIYAKNSGDIYTSNYVDNTRILMQTQLTYVESTVQNNITLNAIYSSNYTQNVNNNLQTQINSKANILHSHIISDITGLSKALQDTSNYTNNYTNNTSNILQVQINNKANASDITNLQITLDTKENTINLGSTQYALVNNTNGKVAVSTLPSAQLSYLSDVTASIQAQINTKEANISLGSTQYALINNTSGKIAISTLPSAQLGYLSDVTAAIQAQLNTKEANISLGSTQYTLINNTNGKVAVSTLPGAQLGYLSDVSAAIQAQLNTKDNIQLGSTQYVLINNISGKVSVSSLPSAQLGYLSDVTGAIQAQLNTKDNIQLGSTQYALINNTSGKVAVSTITNTKLSYLSDVTAAIQAQLNTKEGTITTLPVSKGGTGKGTITASRLLGCTTANQVDEIQLGTNLSFTGNTLNAAGGGSAQWTNGTNLIYYNTGTVGIGKTNPDTSYKLDITGGVFVSGSILATGNITASYSDMRLKDIVERIENPIEKVMKINTFKYKPSVLAQSLNIHDNVQVGVSAQDVKTVLPEVVSLAAFDTSNLPSGEVVSKSGSEYLTVSYERLVPLLIECIKELNSKIEVLTQKIQ